MEVSGKSGIGIPRRSARLVTWPCARHVCARMSFRIFGLLGLSVGLRCARDMESSLVVAELFYLATVGGARVMELEKTIGNFEVGKEFDAILVNTAVENSPVDVFDHDTVETKFEKYLFVGDDRNNEKIFVQGKEVRLPGAEVASRK